MNAKRIYAMKAGAWWSVIHYVFPGEVLPTSWGASVPFETVRAGLASLNPGAEIVHRTSGSSIAPRRCAS